MTLRHITIQKTGCQNTLSLDVRTSNLANDTRRACSAPLMPDIQKG